MTDSFFFDSYALVEIINGSKTYEKYVNAEIITTKLNIFEVYRKLIKDNRLSEAEEFLEKGYMYVIDFDREDIKFAVEFKLNYEKRNISMADAIGYALAKRLDIKFLTGDKEFEKMENVEFVK